jgi:hypothetical protein
MHVERAAIAIRIPAHIVEPEQRPEQHDGGERGRDP